MTSDILKTASTATQCQTIKTHLLAGRSISIWQSIQLYRITCLAQRVYDLKASGLPIQTKLVCENGKRFARYWIDPADIHAITHAMTAGGFKA